MEQALRHGTAVLIDRNSFQRKLLRNLLRSSGFSRLSEMDCIETGLAEANRSYPDFVFIDYDTARRSDLLRGQKDLRSDHLQPSTNLIVMLDNATRFRVQSAIATGANWVLCRPFSPKVLDRRIRAVLDPGSLHRTGERSSLDDLAAQVANQNAPAETEKVNKRAMTRMVEEMDNLLKRSVHYTQDNEPSKTPSRPTSTKRSFAPTKAAEPSEDEAIILL